MFPVSSSPKPLPRWRYVVGVLGIVLPAAILAFSYGPEPDLDVLMLVMLWSITWGSVTMLRAKGKNTAANHGLLGLVVGFLVIAYPFGVEKGGILLALILAVGGAGFGLVVGLLHEAGAAIFSRRSGNNSSTSAVGRNSTHSE